MMGIGIVYGLLFLGLTGASWANETPLTDSDFLSQVTCRPYEEVSHLLFFRSPLDQADFIKSKKQTHDFIKKSDVLIAQSLASNDFESAAVSCSIIDELTSGFSLPCLDDEGKNILPFQTIEICKKLVL